jgi:hypothetical protein
MEKKEKRHILTGGLILITLGVLIFIGKTTPYAFTMTWPILLIAVAAGTLLQNPKDIGGWIIGVAGIIFLLKETGLIDLGLLDVYLLPVILIVLGISIIIRQKKRTDVHGSSRK